MSGVGRDEFREVNLIALRFELKGKSELDRVGKNSASAVGRGANRPSGGDHEDGKRGLQPLGGQHAHLDCCLSIHAARGAKKGKDDREDPTY
jgi:hypothetical protein